MEDEKRNLMTMCNKRAKTYITVLISSYLIYLKFILSSQQSKSIKASIWKGFYKNIAMGKRFKCFTLKKNLSYVNIHIQIDTYLSWSF